MLRELSQEAVIIGAGVIGLAIARELHRRGLTRITILDSGKAGREASFAAAGMLAVQAETDETGEFFDLCRAARDVYPDFAADIQAETGIDIELDRAGTIYLAFNDSDIRELSHRYEWQRRAGLQVERLSARETCKLEPFVSPDVRESLLFPDDWQVENRRLLAALERSAARNGLVVEENRRVDRLIVKNGRAIGVETPVGKIYSQRVVLAAGAWTSLIGVEGIEIPTVRPVRGQILAFQTAKRLFSHVVYSPRGYIVPRADGRILAGATVEEVGYANEMTPAGIDFVATNAFEISPALSGLPIAERCSGLRPRTTDGLPLIGTFPQVENLFIATAHYRNGILLAPLTAQLTAEMIVGNGVPELLKGFGPNRF